MIDAQIRDDECLPFVLDKMMGKMVLEEGTTEQDEIRMYEERDHVNYFVPSGDGFLCVSICESHVFIPFAWHIGKHSTLKEMVKLGKELYKFYTVGQRKRIYYTGLKNFYGHNSKKFDNQIWIFEPKHID